MVIQGQQLLHGDQWTFSQKNGSGHHTPLGSLLAVELAALAACCAHCCQAFLFSCALRAQLHPPTRSPFSIQLRNCWPGHRVQARGHRVYEGKHCDHTAGHRVLGAQGRLSHHTAWWDFLFFIFYKKQLNLLQAYSILEYRVCAFTRVHDVHALSSFIGSERASRPQSSCEAHAHFIGHRVYLINDVSKAFSYVYCVTASFWSPSRLLSAYWSRFGNMPYYCMASKSKYFST